MKGLFPPPPLPVPRPPERAVNGLLAGLLSLWWALPLEEGEFDLLEGRVIALEPTDVPVRMAFTLSGGSLRAVCPEQADTRIRGRSEAFASLAGGDADPDALFFQRRLSVHGDVSLAVGLSNVLQTHPPPLTAVSRRVAPLLRAL